MPRTKKILPAHVLHLGLDELELLVTRVPGHEAVLRIDIKGLEAPEIAQAAATLLKERGAPSRPCVVALGAELLQEKVITLPDLPPKELKQVMLRKAAQLLEVSKNQAAYVAVPLHRRNEDDETSAWLLAAKEQQAIIDLELAFRALNLPVTRVVSARGALVAHGVNLASADDAPIVVVAREMGAASVSLVRAGRVVQQTVLRGQISADDPGSAVMLVQELKNLGVFWRRASRGEEIARVAVVGFERAFLTQFQPAVHAALGGLEVVSDVDEASDLDTARRAALAACRTNGSLALELTVGLPPRKRRAAAFAVAAVVLAGWAGEYSWSAWSWRANTRDRTLVRSVEETSELGQLTRLRSLLEEARLDVRTEVRRVEGLAATGVPFEEVIRAAEDAFGRRANLLSLQIANDGTNVTLTIGGRTEASPEESLVALSRLREDLESSRFVSEVRVEPPTNVPDSGFMKFGVRARLEDRL